jgi:hypothetical protein
MRAVQLSHKKDEQMNRRRIVMLLVATAAVGGISAGAVANASTIHTTFYGPVRSSETEAIGDTSSVGQKCTDAGGFFTDPEVNALPEVGFQLVVECSIEK